IRNMRKLSCRSKNRQRHRLYRSASQSNRDGQRSRRLWTAWRASLLEPGDTSGLDKPTEIAISEIGRTVGDAQTRRQKQRVAPGLYQDDNLRGTRVDKS